MIMQVDQVVCGEIGYVFKRRALNPWNDDQMPDVRFLRRFVHRPHPNRVHTDKSNEAPGSAPWPLTFLAACAWGASVGAPLVADAQTDEPAGYPVRLALSLAVLHVKVSS